MYHYDLLLLANWTVNLYFATAKDNARNARSSNSLIKLLVIA